MGQYFMAVNKTKREFVRLWDLGVWAKLWEWCANKEAGIFPYLLRRSSEGGGGDADHNGAKFAGRWAGDEIYLVDDYDESRLYKIAQDTYKNIAGGLVAEYNEFIQDPELRLECDQSTD